MKLLLDENLSRRIVPALQDAFPGSTQLILAGLERADDRAVWEYAREHGYEWETDLSLFLVRQEKDGSWYGRWGVNYLYGTTQVLRGLRAIGINMQEDWVQRGRRWLEAHQNGDGGWGESCASYLDPEEKGRGESTASQTARALMGLCAFAEHDRASVQRGVDYLLSQQNSDGTWSENLPTGTGFPGILYLRYDYYRIYWPSRALAISAACLERLRRSAGILQRRRVKGHGL